LSTLYHRHEGEAPGADTVVRAGAVLRAQAAQRLGDEEDLAACAAVLPAAAAESGRRPSMASFLVKLTEEIEFFHDTDGTGYARLAVDAIGQVHPLNGRDFRAWLGREFFREHDKAPSAQALKDALAVLEGRALHEGPERTVFTRVAGLAHEVWLDLGDADHAAVRVTRDGWRVLEHDQVTVDFIRPRTMRPLPRPTHGGSLAGALEVMNLPEDGGEQLALGWVLGTLAPSGPYLVALVVGEQGSAKSFTCRALRSLVDPAQPELRGRPRSDRDLIVAARRNWICGFDNFSTIGQDLSDDLARLATGTGFGTRQLYTDADEFTFAGARPILLNGIGMPVTSADLLDRALVLELPGSRRPTTSPRTSCGRRSAPSTRRPWGSCSTG
jgi:hypothetical protein